MVRGKDASWEHCSLTDAKKQKVRCNYCLRVFSGGIYRMKFHLAQIRNKDIVPCTKVPDDVRDKILNILNSPKKPNTPKKPKVDEVVNAEHSSSASDDAHPSAALSELHGSTDPSPLLPHMSPGITGPTNNAHKQKLDDADKKIAAFFFHNSIPFSAAKSVFYQEMVDAIVDCGAGYRAPSYENLRTSLLEKAKGEISDCYAKFRDDWRETGCTIFCNSLSGRGEKLFLVFAAAGPRGTLFLKSIDVSSRADDAHFIFELLESVVLEVEIDNIVQVITSDDTSFVHAGRLLMEKYTSLFWSPCASYCIDKMLEDISKLDWVEMVLDDCKRIMTFIYNDSLVLAAIRKFTSGMELVRPKITRLVTQFLSLRAVVLQEDNLKHMFSHVEWLLSVQNRCPDAFAIKSLLYSERFWVAAHEAVNVSEPLLKLLRIVDGDMPAMGYIYEGMERAKLAIKTYYKGVEEKYLAIWDVIDRRWNRQHTSVHAAAAFLNPSVYYDPNFKNDIRMRNGFQEVMSRMLVDERDKIEITKEQPVYINAQGALATEFCRIGRTFNTPGDWWAAYGYETPTLQKAAIRILSQPCSSHWCRWNWRTFKSLHTMKRNAAEFTKFSNLVFVHCNLWLRAISHSRDGKSEPIVYDEIDVNSKWPTESEAPSSLLDDSWLDGLPLK